jgi:UDP-3-O-[3-hydroxymyristoyl] glucosamine N-acyltransferase
MACAVINADSIIGKHCIVNTGAIIEHDCVILDYTHIAPNATLGGIVRVGRRSHVGIGATIRNKVIVADDCTIGAGAVVVNNISERGVYVGFPAKRMKK